MKQNLIWLLVALVAIALLAVAVRRQPHAALPAAVIARPVAPASTPEPPPRNPRAWEHRLSIDGVTPGMAAADVEKRLGKATVTADGVLWKYEHPWLEFMVVGGKVQMVGGADLRQGTHELLKAGAGGPAILAALGPPDDKQALSAMKPDSLKFMSHPERISDSIWTYRSAMTNIELRVDAHGTLLGVQLLVMKD